MGAPHEMMTMPACHFSDALVTHRTPTVLLFPQAQHLPSSAQMLRHPEAPAGCNVRLPLRVVRIGLALDFRVPPNRHTTGAEETDVLHPP